MFAPISRRTFPAVFIYYIYSHSRRLMGNRLQYACILLYSYYYYYFVYHHGIMANGYLSNSQYLRFTYYVRLYES